MENQSNTTAKLVLTKSLADLLFAVKFGGPIEVGQKITDFTDVLDRYITWRIDGALIEFLAQLKAEAGRTRS